MTQDSFNLLNPNFKLWSLWSSVWFSKRRYGWTPGNFRNVVYLLLNLYAVRACWWHFNSDVCASCDQHRHVTYSPKLHLHLIIYTQKSPWSHNIQVVRFLDRVKEKELSWQLNSAFIRQTRGYRYSVLSSGHYSLLIEAQIWRMRPHFADLNNSKATQ